MIALGTRPTASAKPCKGTRRTQRLAIPGPQLLDRRNGRGGGGIAQGVAEVQNQSVSVQVCNGSPWKSAEFAALRQDVQNQREGQALLERRLAEVARICRRSKGR